MFPHPQRDFRAPMPARPSPRLAASAEHLARVAGHLTDRDRWIARLCAEHRVLTSQQISTVGFGSQRVANRRLRQLHAWRVLNRFQPYVARGRAPMCYVLDITGAHLLAHEDGTDPTALRFRPERTLGIAYSLRLAHQLGINNFFTALIGHAQNQDQRCLTAWWSEPRCAAAWGDHVRPDGYGRWSQDGQQLEWFLEWDTGSYALPRLASKLDDYFALAAASGVVTPLLIVLPTARREAAARRQLTHHVATHPARADLPVATTTAEHLRSHTDGPAGAVWQPLEPAQPKRTTLIGLVPLWPQLTDLPEEPPQAIDQSSQRTARLRAPAPMPPWQPGELSWPTRTQE